MSNDQNQTAEAVLSNDGFDIALVAIAHQAGFGPDVDLAALKRVVDAAQRVAAAAECERICAAIKAEDDHCAGADYMLDSDDCIKVARGEWVRPEIV